MQVWVNGKADGLIPATDRGLLYGDGFFTTVCISNHNAENWAWHWRRIERCASTLSLPLQSLTSKGLKQEIEQAAARCFSSGHAGVRITLTRGSGGQGYTPPERVETRLIVSCFAVPQYYPQWREQGVHLGVASNRLAPQMTALVGLKTLNRLEQVVLKQELTASNWQDLVVLEQSGYVAETTAANLFWRRKQQWFTPKLSRTGVHGSMRAMLLALNPSIQLGDYRLEHVYEADEAFICNALLGCAPVRSIDKLTFPAFGAFRGLVLKE
ncbi:aminodeoxychorismate lyase [Aliidiomarina celeris]|uniref:aminodeoxychorismate lyase n=1 Tax=Aliidiomarina celeris TaxID=2249428 RepID=UPI000DE83A3A|nr:aminodeoxychorismate lyase [Aliidiomarina celeris]